MIPNRTIVVKMKHRSPSMPTEEVKDSGTGETCDGTEGRANNYT